MIEPASRIVFISAAETSGDMHAGKLVRQLRVSEPRVRCVGLGGPAMMGAGCHLLENLVERSAMLAHALGQVRFYWQLLGRVKSYLESERPELVVLVDSPAWNFHVAKAAKALGIPVLYYIAPQLWAWGAWRIGKLRRRVDKVACILPFEEQWFRQRGVDAEYVGHPLFDDEHPVDAADPPVLLDGRGPLVALLPGSRRQEIDRLWKPMNRIARIIKDNDSLARFVTVASDDRNADLLGDSADESLEIEVRRGGIEAAVRHADLALVASGTATLEVAAQRCPMIIMYYVHPLAWHLVGRWVVKTKYMSLVNILARRELVPEIMPFYGQVNKVVGMALGLLDDAGRVVQMRAELGSLMRPIVEAGASEKVAGMIMEMIGPAGP